jgi:hypothetical protein
MDITRVGGSANAATTSVTSITVTIPSGIVTGDVGLIIHGYNPVTGTPTTPAGWTAGTAVTSGASTQFIPYTRDLVPADAGTIVTIVNTAAQRLGAALEVYRSSDFNAV